MMEYNKYMNWINGFETKDLFIGDESFKTHESVKKKVNRHNKFIPYYGDTIVFNLDYRTKRIVSGIISTLYSILPECFCEKLQSNTIHMTLHDLSSNPKLDNVKEYVLENEKRIRELLKTNPILPQKIRMRTNNISNSSSISLVLALAPTDKYEYEKLMKIYELFDKVRDLNRTLIPHITLGYYNQYGFNEKKVSELKKLIRELNKQKFDVVLNTEELVYQFFTSMNSYETIMKLTDI